MSGECILVVDDEPDIRYLLSRAILPGEGYATIAAANGRQALQILSQTTPDLMLLDIHLPDISGVEILKELRSLRRDVPTVLVTADNSTELAVQVLKLGVRDFIIKPFDPDEAIDIVRRVLGQVRLERDSQSLNEEVRRTNKLLRKRIRQLNELYAVGKAVTSSLELERVLNQIVAAACRLTGADSSVLFLWEPEEELLYLYAAHGMGPLADGPVRVPFNDRLALQVIYTGKSLLLNSSAHRVKTAYLVNSLIYVPLRRGRRVIGVMGVYSSTSALTFAEEDRQVLSAMADYAAVAVENARLFDQTRKRLVETQILLDLGRELAKLLPLDELLLVAVREAARILPNINKAIIHLWDEQAGRLIPRASSRDGLLPPANVRGIYIGEGIAGCALEEGRPIRITDTTSSPQFVVLDETASFRSLLSVPLRVGDEKLGTLTIDSRQVGAFTAEHEEFATIFAHQLAIAIKNARLYKDLREQYQDLEIMQRIASELGHMTLDIEVEQVISRVNEQAAKLLGATKCAILLYSSERNALVGQIPAYGVPDDVMSEYVVPLDKSPLAAYYWRMGEVLPLSDLQRNKPFVQSLGLQDLARRAGVQHSLFAMLRVGGRRIGVIQVSDREDGKPFDDGDVRLLSIFAPHIAIAIENARTLQQVRALHQIGEAIASRLDLDEVLSRIVGGIHKIIEVEGVAIWQMQRQSPGEDATLVLRTASSKELSQWLPRSVEVGQGLVGGVAQSGKWQVFSSADKGAGRMPVEVRSVPGIRSVLCLPIPIRRGIWGVIELFNKAGSDFDERDIELLEIILASVTIGIENASMYAAERSRAARRAALLEAEQSLIQATTGPLSSLLAQVAAGALRIVNADCAVVYPFAPQDDTVYDVKNISAIGLRHPLRVRRSPMPDDPAELVRQREVLVWHRGDGDLPLDDHPFIRREDIWAMVGLHLSVWQESLGVLYVSFRHPHDFDEEEITILRLFASHASIAIQNARLFHDLNRRYDQIDRELARSNQELRRSLEELRHLRRIDKTISSTLDLNQVMREILRGALDIIGVERGTIMLLDSESREVVSTFDEGLSCSTDDFSAHKIGLNFMRGKKRASCVPNIEGKAFANWPWKSWYRKYMPEARSGLSVPILDGETGMPMGVINIGSPKPHAFDERDRRLLESLARQAAVAIRNAQYVQEIQREQERRNEAEKLASLGDLAGNMVHRINNAVGAIRAFVQQVQARLDRGDLDDDYLRRKLGAILENAERTLEMARKIRQPFQLHRTDVEPVSVNRAILSALNELNLPPSIQVSKDLSPDLPPVMATEQLREVFHNLIKNAWEAMGDRGHLSLQSWLSADGKFVKASVTDSGPGIAPEQQREIFRLGHTSKGGSEHLGYGLWWTKMFLQRLGGNIELESRVERGCRFTVTLPVTMAGEEEGVAADEADRSGVDRRG